MKGNRFARIRKAVAVSCLAAVVAVTAAGCGAGVKNVKGVIATFDGNDVPADLAQIDTAGLGITLTAADTCVYYSVNFNYAAYSQSLARIHRIGQRNVCTYIHLTVEKTIDEIVLKALHKKEDLAKTIVDNWQMYFE